MEILDHEEIKSALEGLPGWKYSDNKLSKEYKFADFAEAFEFISGLVEFFELNDHHPDIHMMYNKVLFELQRADAGGKVTDKDIKTAAAIEQAFSEMG